jgi:hypothetical protein
LNTAHYQFTIRVSNFLICSFIHNESEITESIFIYPNPCRDHISIKTQIAGTLQLFNTLGQKILEQKIIAGITTLHLDDFPSGIYVANFICSYGTKWMKIVKD